MDTLDKEIVDDKLTQADLIKLMLHNAQHMATREEVKSDINKVESSLTAKMDKVESKIDKVENKLDRFQWLIIATTLSILFKDYIIGLFS